MKAINLPHYKLKLRDLSKQLYLENGWQMPRGFMDSQERDPANFTLNEWQQAKRGGHDLKALKRMFQECWAIADSRQTFAKALKVRGYTLARGDRRGHVAVDFRGEVYAIAKYVGARAKEVKARLGDAADLMSVDQAKQAHTERMTAMLREHIQMLESLHKRQASTLQQRRKETVQHQREQRAELEKAHRARREREAQQRARRFSTGVRGVRDWMTGKHARIRRQNEQEALLNWQRDRAERERLIFKQIEDRQLLHAEIRQMKQEHARQVAELHRDIADCLERPASHSLDLKGHFGRGHSPVNDNGRERPDREIELGQ
ncbi:relaxase [Ectopseudomonas mendocina]|uniref:Relaxase n=1 Tax=Ectopseudomonas mendocina TaxID=300 RepID=A0A2R3QI33_ECTME|nr:relaxase [Pseudomonas mendocina]AVO51400.1 relaxase [Pseudomonas mendocina]